ncbi:hypothetical protein MCUN1_000830 [Malassezia cuniculi]|uniref:RlpA-like protein double-psi beta-barrel domain-containing protein n=1 Tax=Malassezia cuniculi TaxID=948313 RepID=A0AAF0J506_9BASI|nr:hypothetical protein MCUN1_000830 [Malassezia cuniculi]
MFSFRFVPLVAIALSAVSLVEAAQPGGHVQHLRMVQMQRRRNVDHGDIENAVPEWQKYVVRMQKEGKEPVSLVRFASKRADGWSPFGVGNNNNNGNGNNDNDSSDNDNSTTASSSTSSVSKPSTAASTGTVTSTSSLGSSSASSSSPSSSGSSDGSGSGDMDHTGQGTYYTPGLGSCGEHSTDSDMIVAVSHKMYDSKSTSSNPNSNPLCGKMIEAQYGNRKVQVKVVDRCTGCADTDLDFSPAAFKKLSSIGKGRLHNLKWKFVE